jgi:hypothetical protein
VKQSVVFKVWKNDRMMWMIVPQLWQHYVSRVAGTPEDFAKASLCQSEFICQFVCSEHLSAQKSLVTFQSSLVSKHFAIKLRKTTNLLSNTSRDSYIALFAICYEYGKMKRYGMGVRYSMQDRDQESVHFSNKFLREAITPRPICWWEDTFNTDLHKLICEVVYLEHAEIKNVLFSPHHVGHCCTSVIRGHYFSLGHSFNNVVLSCFCLLCNPDTNAIKGHCCETLCYNKDFASQFGAISSMGPSVPLLRNNDPCFAVCLPHRRSATCWYGWTHKLLFVDASGSEKWRVIS